MKISRYSRFPVFESLETRQLLTSWQNPDNPLDVDASGLVNALDVLVVVSDLLAHGSRRLPSGDASVETPPFLDVNGDDWVTPADALSIVSALFAHQSPITVVANLAPHSDQNANGVVLGNSITIVGQTSSNAMVRLVMGDETTGAWSVPDNDGRFEWELPLSHGINRYRIEARNPLGHVVVVERSVRRADVVLDWNAALLNAFRDWKTHSDDPYPNRIVPSAPPVVARNLAMVHVAMFDAMNAVEQTHVPYHVDLVAAQEASTVAAVATAAYQVASHLYPLPQEQAVWEATWAESLATVPDGPEKVAGMNIGARVADQILSLRANDGAADSVTYVPLQEPGRWNRTAPDWLPPLLPQWPYVTPFAIAGPEPYRPPSPPPLDSVEYARAVDEVMRLGSFHSAERTAEQTEIALFWADGPGTSTPPGHWNRIATDVSLAHGLSLTENARLMALLNMAMADAAIASWDAKYTYHHWRPIDAIRRADEDGNDLTVADPKWMPLLVNPPFPAYTSGHSSFSGAADVVLSHVFGRHVPFTSQSDGHIGLTQRPLAEHQVIVRTFSSFAEAASEASMSRIYGGIHFSFDSSAGLEAGRAIGQYVVDTMLLEAPKVEPG